MPQVTSCFQLTCVKYMNFHRSIVNQIHLAGPTWTPRSHLLIRLALILSCLYIISWNYCFNFLPASVQELLTTFRITGTQFYELAAFGHFQSKGILPGTHSDDMDTLYDWPLDWDLRTPPGDPFFAPLQNSHPDSWQLLVSLGGHFLKRLIAALLAPNGHFSSLLLFTLWGI